MGYYSYCCVLCGAILGDHTGTWLDEFRAVYTEEKQWTSPRLSGIGVITDTVDALIALPLEADQRHDDASLDPSALMDLWLLKCSFSKDMIGVPEAIPQPFWGFPFHESCWILFGILYGPWELDLQALFGMWRSFPIGSGLLNLGHDYGGIMEYYPTPEEHIPGEEYEIQQRYMKQRYYPQNSKRDPMEYTDPLNIPSLQEIFQQSSTGLARGSTTNNTDQTLRANEATSWTNHMLLKGVNSTDCFQLFPTEIICNILIFLSSKDVLNAKLASAMFAAVPLTKTFWASRFQRGFEFHCVFKSQGLQTKDYDWEAIYFSVRNLQDSPGFKNRRRIWRLLLLIEELHSRLILAELQGNISQSFFEPDAPEDKRSWKVASGILHKPDSRCPFSSGCRSLFTRTIDITFQVTGVFLTFARFNGRQYISGIRFQQNNGVNSSLGYVVLNEELKIDADGSLLGKDGCDISGFYLAIDSL
ncbi:hypothetical protein V495_08455 [Pseudogymnoascus sp. VKM F-4514 (FW-929)]|nr:hypothetical protein V495_08455 [Pseudogymnoascus sp. VKM F-4514 (FW-929)]KFY56814.1 hypothetical protein V497_05960 [Pseudogymnoascus sp. VKM F-4516 (FW-969)]